MTNDEWKVKLRPTGVLLGCYFAGPLLARRLLGAQDTVYGSFTISDTLQAGLGVAILRKLLALKELLAGELTARLDKLGQPRERTLELSGRISASAGYISAAALLLPPLGGIFPDSRLLSLVKFCAVCYTAYAAWVIWKLSAPFLAYVPPSEPAAAPDEPRAVPLGRCAKCGQQIDDSMESCAFCGQPVRGG